MKSLAPEYQLLVSMYESDRLYLTKGLGSLNYGYGCLLFIKWLPDFSKRAQALLINRLVREGLLIKKRYYRGTSSTYYKLSPKGSKLAQELKGE